MLDYIIVGQGIAGSLLSWHLLQQKQEVMVIDNYNPSSSSNIAAGITNPITGRRFVKTWLADELIPYAANTYRQFENLFQTNFFSPIAIIKLFDSVKAQNDWSVRCMADEYFAYLKNENILYLEPQKVKNEFGGFETTGGSQLEVEKFLTHYRSFLKKENRLSEAEFSFTDLTKNHDSISYLNLTARKIIFCEGANAINNPYFKFLPFQLAKGECLIIEAEDFYSDKIIVGEVFIMPTQTPNQYYVGSTHAWDFSDDKPSDIGRIELEANLQSVINCPFKIVDQKAAIRPTVKDRRPFIGFHPEHPSIGIFNGMGTKGVSLSPYFARHFTDHLLKGDTLMKEVDIKRFA